MSWKSAALALILGVGAADAATAGVTEDQVVGAWRLVKSEMRTPEGVVFATPRYGLNPKGYIIYDKSHTMCVFLAPATELDPRTPPQFRPEREATEPATYCGRWRLNEDRTAVIHIVEVALHAQILGEQVRRAQIDGDILTIRSPLPAGLVDYYIQFQKVK